MGEFLQILALIVIGVVLLWLGYSLFSGQLTQVRRAMKPKPKAKWRQKKNTADAGDPKTCPVCKSKLTDGELVQTQAYPSITGGRDRMMHIQGCVYCIRGDFERSCPVCYSTLSTRDKLVARMFERPLRRNHIHILGCFKCKQKRK